MLYKNKLINFAIISLLSLLTFFLTSCNSSKAVEKSFPEIIEELDSYKLSASMQTIFQNPHLEHDTSFQPSEDFQHCRWDFRLRHLHLLPHDTLHRKERQRQRPRYSQQNILPNIL